MHHSSMPTGLRASREARQAFGGSHPTGTVRIRHSGEGGPPTAPPCAIDNRSVFHMAIVEVDGILPDRCIETALTTTMLWLLDRHRTQGHFEPSFEKITDVWQRAATGAASSGVWAQRHSWCRLDWVVASARPQRRIFGLMSTSLPKKRDSANSKTVECRGFIKLNESLWLDGSSAARPWVEFSAAITGPTIGLLTMELLPTVPVVWQYLVATLFCMVFAFLPLKILELYVERMARKRVLDMFHDSELLAEGRRNVQQCSPELDDGAGPGLPIASHPADVRDRNRSRAYDSSSRR